jgi:hypothetical protein
MRTYPPTNVRTVHEVIAQAYAEQPNLRLATTPKEDVIGAWSEQYQRFVIVASLTITGDWVSMPYEILINGEAPVREWREIRAEVKA